MPSHSNLPVRHAIVVMGVSGSGKSAIAERLAATLGIDYADADALHPPSNIAKMESSIPLTDEDRWPWLDRVAADLADHDRHPRGVAMACSALRRIYRDRLRRGAGEGGVVFVFLDLSIDTARRRLAGRRGHFMPASLVDSQFATLERPGPEEPDVVTVHEIEGVAETVEVVVDGLGRLP